MAVGVKVRLAGKYLYSVLALPYAPSVGLSVLISWELGERERQDSGRGVDYSLFFSYSFRG